MRRFASRFLLIGLVGAILAFIIHSVGEPGDGLAILDDLRAEADPDHEAFRVGETVRVTIEAAGSFEGGEADTALAAHGWLVHRETGRVVWQMRPAQRPDRGTFVLMRDTLALAPGTYDAYFAALGVPEARTVQRGESFRDRLSDALRGGGKGWVGDADRWRFHVRFAPGEDHDAAREISGDIPEAEDLVWGSGPARSDRLYEVTLRATAPVQVRLDALFEGAGGIAADSAYLVSVEGDTLWTARTAGSTHAGGSLRNRRQTDTLALGPGRYRAVFRSDDSHAYRDWDANPPWEPWRWGLRIAPADSASRAGAIAPEDPLNDLPRLVDLSCVEQESVTREQRFEVTTPLEVTIIAVGEFVGGEAYDYAELVREDGETVWDMRRATRREAGGASKNVRADETLTLDPGTYALRYTTDSSHQCGDYNSGVPDIEDFWGVVVLSTDGEEAGDRLRLLEAPGVISGDALARLLGVGDSQNVTTAFTLTEATDVCVLTLGEINDSSRYDWGSIEGPTSWSLSMANSFHDGGTLLNRMAIAYLTLQPGAYTVRYQTDSNHSAEDFGDDPPNHPNLWGIQVWIAPEGTRDLPDPRSGCVPPGLAVPSDAIPPPPSAAAARPFPPSAAPLTAPRETGPGDTRPEVVGGASALRERVAYPDEARERGEQGTVYVRLVV